MNKSVQEIMNLLRNIRTAFVFLDEKMMGKLIVMMIRPKLECAAVVWSLSLNKHIRKLKIIERAAAKIILAISDETFRTFNVGRANLLLW